MNLNSAWPQQQPQIQYISILYIASLHFTHHSLTYRGIHRRSFFVVMSWMSASDQKCQQRYSHTCTHPPEISFGDLLYLHLSASIYCHRPSLSLALSSLLNRPVWSRPCSRRGGASVPLSAITRVSPLQLPGLPGQVHAMPCSLPCPVGPCKPR